MNLSSNRVEQMNKLREVSATLPIRLVSGDVAALLLSDGREIVCVVDGYDVWARFGEHPILFGLTLDEARAVAS